MRTSDANLHHVSLEEHVVGMVQQPDYIATGKSDEIFSPSVAPQGGGLQEAKYNKKQKKVKKKVQGISEIRRFVRF